ncbi:hypothetical protein QVD17_22837 [Tagetes erecta]|uniref:Transmembrane protein n=1 Tax=Tagetes erecta TaxID=13708 RepID=A0AAD8NTR5_TARER|nr:hypothetical protein QVD17_22837 [Tagetes erecta]
MIFDPTTTTLLFQSTPLEKNKNHHHHLFNESPKHHKSAPNRRPSRCLSPPEVKQDLKWEMMVVVMVVAMVFGAIICCWRHHLATNLTDPTSSTIHLRFVLAIDEDDGGGWCFEQLERGGNGGGE